MRAGTENVAGAVGLATALEEATAQLAERGERLAALRDELVRRIVDAVPDVRPTGDPDPRAVCRASPRLCAITSTASFSSCCSTATASPPPPALPAQPARPGPRTSSPRWASPTRVGAHGSLRLSLADDVTADDIALLAERVPAAIRRARNLSAMV